MDSLRWEAELPKLRSPVMICSFRGWNDAAAAASTALAAIGNSLDSELVAEVRAYTDNLSATIEEALRLWLRRAKADARRRGGLTRS